MSKNTKSYARGVAARKVTNAAVVSTRHALASFISMLGDTASGFIQGDKPAKRAKSTPRTPAKRKTAKRK
jgi:hypothetical protein